MKWTAEKSAALTYLLPVLAVSGIWYILLFTSNVPNPDYGEMLRTWFTDDLKGYFFWWLAAIPLVCLGLGAAYISPLATRRTAAIVLAAVGVSLAVATWCIFDASIAIFVSLPLMFSVPRAWLLTMRWSGP